MVNSKKHLTRKIPNFFNSIRYHFDANINIVIHYVHTKTRNKLEKAETTWNELEQAETNWNKLEPNSTSWNELELPTTSTKKSYDSYLR